MHRHKCDTQYQISLSLLLLSPSPPACLHRSLLLHLSCPLISISLSPVLLHLTVEELVATYNLFFFPFGRAHTHTHTNIYFKFFLPPSRSLSLSLSLSRSLCLLLRKAICWLSLQRLEGDQFLNFGSIGFV
ncbi:hypothetical protein O6H91_14G001300 [Diphasiastrum complanatum]|uniref:Uncharacterized protein n=1 Tax=Diphasiastrum complanatum TaxID=34168 RepID=A0ACC2BKU3_DIPCM|nr:hypothetical protein O6H91_14G001300 [Diphasiastrum complanatum]